MTLAIVGGARLRKSDFAASSTNRFRVSPKPQFQSACGPAYALPLAITSPPRSSTKPPHASPSRAPWPRWPHVEPRRSLGAIDQATARAHVAAFAAAVDLG